MTADPPLKQTAQSPSELAGAHYNLGSSIFPREILPGLNSPIGGQGPSPLKIPISFSTLPLP